MTHLELLKHAENIYKDENDCNHFYSDLETGLQVGIYINDKICISFRGTEAKEDVLCDIYRFKTNIGGCKKVHGGFYNQLFNSSIYEEFNSKVTKLIYETNLEIYITGHSLGGGLATLYGYELSNKTNKMINVVSFASPKVGNWAFKKSFDEKENLKLTRVVNTRDPIPLFPLINYYHSGDKLNLNSPDYFYSFSSHYAKTYKTFLTELNN